MEALQYVHLKCDKHRTLYSIVDDKVVDGEKKLVLLTVNKTGYGHYIEAYPDEVEPVDRPLYDMGVTAGPAD
jgi:hypothetical protein